MKKSVKLTALFCAAALLASSMLSPMSVAVQAKAKKPALSKKKITITLGKTAKLKVKRATGCKITWKSKKKKVVTVKKSGKYAAKLKAKKKGTAKVIATLKKGRKKYKLTCKVKVVLIDDTSSITSNNPNVSTDASATPTAPTQGKTDITSTSPSASPSGSPSDVPTAMPTDTSGVPASATPTATGNVTATPTATGNVTATPTATGNVTATPTQKPTATPSQKPTATPTQKPTATPSQKPTATATATVKPTETATAKPTDTATQQPTPTSGSTPVPTSNSENYSMTLSAATLIGSGATEGNPVYNADGSVTLTLTNQYGGGGIAFYFNELKSKVDVSGYTKAVFNLSADEQAPICISAYRSTDYWDDSEAGKAIALSYPTVTTEKKDFNCELTKCNEVLGFGVKYNTYGKEPDEIPEKFNLTIHSITFIGSSGGSVVTPTPTSVSTPTPVPVVTPAPEQDVMTFSADTFLTSAAINGSPVYNEDGSVTVILKKESGGGGIAFSIDENKMPVDLSNYSKVIYTLSADVRTPLQISAYRSTNFWAGTEDTKSILLSYGEATTEKKDYSYELTNLGNVLGFGIRYNAYNSEMEEVTVTIHSITLVKDTRDINDAIDNYTSLAKLAAEYGLMMGTVMNDRKVKDQKYGDLMKYHFNSITAANEMKAYSMLNESASKEAAKSDANAMPVLNFTSADAIMDFAKANGLKVRGHALVWDAGMKDWFFREGYDTSKSYASAEVVKARLKNYIEQVLAHFEEKYPGIIYCWDVVNEAVGDSSSEYAKGDDRHVRTMRGGASNPFYDIIGSDYVELSFQYTYEALQELKKTYEDLDIKLYYNDYNTFYADKRDAICALVNSINKFKSDGNGGYVKLCDGVGMQSYIGGFGSQNGCMNESNIDMVKTAILKFAAQGVEVQVTELAVRNYQNDEATIAKHGDFYKKLFQAYLDVNSGEEKPLKAISIWGIVDIPDLPEEDYSFTMNGPFCGLFDETLAVKPAFINIHDLMKNGLENDQ